MADGSFAAANDKPVPPWPLLLFLSFALLLRLPAVLWADGFAFVDQQYQYVDPAWHLATGLAWHRPWEWIDGVRSLVYPGLLAGLFRALLWLGLEDPMWLMRAVRGVHALVSLLPMWLFWLLVVRWRPLPPTRWLRLAMLLFASSGFVVLSGVQPSGPAFAATLALAAAIAVQGPGRFPLLGGLCLGLAFCGRFQDALFGPALLAVLLWQRRWQGAVWFACGCVPGIVLQGCIDLAVHGRFLATVWQYVHTNLGLGAADKWPSKPWWFYLVAGVVPTVAFVPPVWRVAWQRCRAGAGILPSLAAAALFHIAVHSCIARKSLRFEYGALAMLVAVVAVGVAASPPRQGERLARWHTGALVTVHALLLLYASLWFGNAGAVKAALALRGDAKLAGELLVVGGDATSLGGFFYLQPPADRVVGVPRKQLRERLQRSPPAPGSLVIAVEQPIEAVLVDGLGVLEPVGTFAGMFDLRNGERRYLYRWR